MVKFNKIKKKFGNGGLETSLRKLEIKEIPISAKNEGMCGRI